ncbi:MerC domain-containing protein [Sphingomonas sp. CJ99]
MTTQSILTGQGGTAGWLRAVPGIDRLAIIVSGLCVVHCVATLMLVSALTAAGGGIVSPHLHELGLVLAILFGAVGLGVGALNHGYLMPVATGAFGLGVMAGALTVPHGAAEAAATVLGVLIVALGHDLNRRAAG